MAPTGQSRMNSSTQRTGIADGEPVRLGLLAAALANALVLGIAVCAAALHEFYPDIYYQASQEDEVLEWTTFWAFTLAAALFCASVWHLRKATHRIGARGAFPWFQLGIAAFCFVVAMEEISWGQRILGYRPPDYFLAENFQQELNFHNVVPTGARKLAVKTVLLGYGALLPLLALVPAVRRLLRRLGIVEPPWQVMPMFLAAFAIYEVYPWSYSGEWVEVLMGFGFFFAALAQTISFRSAAAEEVRASTGPGRAVLTVAVAWLLVVGLGWLGAVVLRRARIVGTPELLAQTERELDALRRDFQSGEVEADCNLHKRLFSFKEKYEQDYLLEGAYSGLVADGMPLARANYFIDPWNSPYWIRDRCQGDHRVRFIYSFGPNRGRDSDRWRIKGDDTGVYLSDERGPPE